jgi:Stress responsive A/B Barrel Domain
MRDELKKDVLVLIHPSSLIPHPLILMLTHIVIWKYREDVEQAVREEHIARLRHLANVITEVESLSVGLDVLHLARSFDTGLVAIFRDRAALDAYTVHPEHVAVATLGSSISEHIASVDFESL